MLNVYKNYIFTVFTGSRLLLNCCSKLLCYCWRRTLNYRCEGAEQQMHQAAYIYADFSVFTSLIWPPFVLGFF